MQRGNNNNLKTSNLASWGKIGNGGKKQKHQGQSSVQNHGQTTQGISQIPKTNFSKTLQPLPMRHDTDPSYLAAYQREQALRNADHGVAIHAQSINAANPGLHQKKKSTSHNTFENNLHENNLHEAEEEIAYPHGANSNDNPSRGPFVNRNSVPAFPEIRRNQNVKQFDGAHSSGSNRNMEVQEMDFVG
jgi:hypothetical protein